MVITIGSRNDVGERINPQGGSLSAQGGPTDGWQQDNKMRVPPIEAIPYHHSA